MNEKTNTEALNFIGVKVFKIKLEESNKDDTVFGKVDVWKTDSGLKILELKEVFEAPAGFVAKSNVGVLKTEKFYFLFQWKTCVNNNTVDFSKLTGLLELAHGTNRHFFSTLDPFTPPGKNIWKLHHMSPFGTVSSGFVNYGMLKTRIFSSSIIDLTNDTSKGTHTLWDDVMYEITEEHKDFVHQDEKYKQSRKKYISGTNKKENNSKIMDLELAKFNTGENFQKQHLPQMLTTTIICNTIGLVITRNRLLKKTYLSDMLADINEYGFPTNLVISSCRSRSDKKIWEEKWNLGPKTYYLLGEKNGFQDNFDYKYGEPSPFSKQVDFTE